MRRGANWVFAAFAAVVLSAAISNLPASPPQAAIPAPGAAAFDRRKLGTVTNYPVSGAGRRDGAKRVTGYCPQSN
jgi:hypothetical protein